MTKRGDHPALLIAGTHSGAGKTTVSLILIRALAARGYQVQPFKIGPDFIDPGYHAEAAGRASINLDVWMMGTAKLRQSFARFGSVADVSIIESMGALFDGENGVRERGSAAHIAKLLGVPVILVVDIWGMTRSTAALLRGFSSFDPRLKIAGFIFNRAGSGKHYDMVIDSLPAALQRRAFGYVLHSEKLAIPERHLGLITADEMRASASARADAMRAGGEFIDLSRLDRAFGLQRRPRPRSRAGARLIRARRTPRIAIARDEAFCFYYSENLRLLEEAGAELRFFSPLHDRAPPDADGFYLGGGYPESFAAQLAANPAMRAALKERARQGTPIYAECGGFMYLGRSLIGFDCVSHAMAGVFPVDFLMDREYLAIRYVEVTTRLPTLLGPPGTVARGQEFHQSRISSGRRRAGPGNYQVVSSTGEAFSEGFRRRNALGSYIHLHFASNSSIPRFFVRECARHANRENP